MGWNTNPNIDDEWVAKSMEQYANYKNKALENKIREFRNNIKDKCKIWENWDTTPSLSEQYDKHFNIKQ